MRMQRRFVYIWFKYLLTDWLSRAKPALKQQPLALTHPEKGQVIIAALNASAENAGARGGMPLADARSIAPQLLAMEYETGRPEKILKAMAEWCSRYSPLVTVDRAEGLWLDMTGGMHLFGGEKPLLEDVNRAFRKLDYAVRIAVADTPGGAWAIARHAPAGPIVAAGALRKRLSPLPVEALRLPPELSARLISLGLRTIGDLYALPRGPLARRLGQEVLLRLDQALGDTAEALTPFRAPPVLEMRAHVSEGVMVLDGIILVLKKLIGELCAQLGENGDGLRRGRFQAFLFDGQVQTVDIQTSSPSKNAGHLFKLFEEKALKMNVGFGAESFVLAALVVEKVSGIQKGLDDLCDTQDNPALLPELIDRLHQRLGHESVYSLHPRQSHLPERCIAKAAPLAPATPETWPQDRPRPVLLLPRPAPIDVVAPVPDYPPMMFRYKGKQHRIRHAEGPERIEQEWWRQKGELRDYYRLEDEAGQRYWIYRLGHYAQGTPSRWFLHGFFG